MSNHLGESIFHGEQDADVVQTRAGRQRPPKKRGAGRALILLLTLALVGGATYAAFGFVKPIYDQLTESNDYPGPGAGEATVVVKSGESGSVIGKTLVTAGVIKSTAAFVEASSANAKLAAAIQPGTYLLKKQMTAADALKVLGDPKNRDVKHVTIREGLWVNETLALLSKGSGIPVAQYEAAIKDPESIGLPDVAKGNPEGWLYPETYDMNDDSAKTAAGQLSAMVAATKKQLDAAGVGQENYQKVLTVASITEAEARESADLGKVARVIENRLDNPTGPTVGRLEMDSTVNYALKKRGLLTKTEFDSAKSNPYDTYGHKGLPPGPIGSPGAESIKAAANPTPGPWFFFVTVNLDSGETKFAETLSEHNTYVAELNAWCTANSGKCSG